jgi:hypothetical protein
MHIEKFYGTIYIMEINKDKLKESVRKLRKEGKTYLEIKNDIKVIIPKSTLSYWCKDINLPKEHQERIRRIVLTNAQKGREIALVVNRVKREKYLESVVDRNQHLSSALKNKDVAKITLAMLYLGEGSKTQRGFMTFANSDPFVVSLFLYLLRYCYNIHESKFRCTIQPRADQNIKKLEKFWSDVTKIPLSQFYKARIDPRTLGKRSKKLDYKGVCRIDYFSGDLLIELMQIPKIIYQQGPVV